MNILSYHVYDGIFWLADDEKTWTRDFHSSAAFLSAELADDIGKRQAAGKRTIYVLACLGTK